MDEGQAERFVAAAEADYQMCVGDYMQSMRPTDQNPESRRYARADVVAAQQVLDLARNELRWQQVCARQAAAEQEKRQTGEAE